MIAPKLKRKVTPNVNVSVLDNVFTAMKGHRLFDRFGFNLPISVKYKTGKFTSLIQYDEWLFDT